MKKLKLFVILLLFGYGCNSIAIDSDVIVKNLRDYGKKYFQKLINTQEYENILDKIEKGDIVLIKNSHLLKQWVDASTATSLRFALSRAIIKEPEAVMNLVPKYYSATDLCTIPYIEETFEIELLHVNNSIASLSAVTNRKSNTSAQQCIDIYMNIKKT